MEKTEPCRLKPGARHVLHSDENGVVYLAPGSVIELTQTQAIAWRDKFVPIRFEKEKK